MSKNHVIRHGGAFYRPSAQGYSYSIHEAGRWTKEEAEKHVNNDPLHIVTIHHESEFLPNPSPITPDIGGLVERANKVDGYDCRNPEHMALIADLATALQAIQAERDEAREIVALANNSVFGSYGYFTQASGKTLAQGIEDIKTLYRDAWAERNQMEANWLAAKRRSFDAHLAKEAAEKALAEIASGAACLPGYSLEDAVKTARAIVEPKP